MDPSLLIGLDFGGGGARCLLLDPANGRVTCASRPCDSQGAPGTGGLGVDLDLESLWSALAGATREALLRADASPDAVAAVAATSMRFGTVVLDEAGAPLLAVPNRDARAALEGLQLAAEHGEALYQRSGQWPVPVCAAPRLRWLATNRPDDWKRAASVLAISDWITWRLCGERVTEPSQAGCTLLLDLESRDWAADWLDRLELRPEILPRIGRPTEPAGTLGADAAEALGLRAGTPVVIGGGDSQCGLLGAGAVAPGQRAAITGTTAPVQLVLGKPLLDPEARLWTGHHVAGDRFVLESNAGPMGDAVSWLARVLHPDSARPEARLLAEARDGEPGAAGLFSTLGAEVMNGREMGLPIGHLALTHMTTPGDPHPRRHLVRAVVEGLAYGVRANLEQIEEVAGARGDAGPLKLGGGMARSDTWCQVLADVLGTELEVAAHVESSALGVALCAGVGAGVFESLEEAVQRCASPSRTVSPDPERAAAYQERYAQWCQLRGEQARARATAGALATPAMLSAVDATAPVSRETPQPRILVTADFDPESLATLGELGQVEYASFRDEMRLLTGDSLVSALQGVQVFVTEIDILDAVALSALPDLRVVAACRGDAVNVDVEACSAFGVPVLFAPGRNADAVADLTLAFLLMLARKLPEASAFLYQPDVGAGDMGKMGQAFSRLQGRELWHKTVGLVGLGAVGRGVAARLAGFGARVLVADPYVDAEAAARSGTERVSLEQLLEQSDFVSLHAAVSDETRGLMGAAELARMKPGAFLLNTARAALVDEGALHEALASGHLAGAALDAFAVEPPGPDHPLLQLPSVIATPHVGGNTTDVAAHQGLIVTEALAALLRGERPRAVLNPATLDSFDWDAPRPVPAPEVLRQLAERPPPAVSDLQRAGKPTTPEPASEAGPGSVAAPQEIVDGMERVVRAFIARLTRDDWLAAFAAGKDVTLHFTLSDLGVQLHFALRDGEVLGGLGAPDHDADVQLRMRAYVFDGMFTGTVNAMEAAMNGEMSFTGDAAKAMTLQEMQRDLSRLYLEAREEAGDPGDLASLPDPAAAGAGAATASPVAPGDVREQIVDAVQELYRAELITATGGNVSARIADADEVWITPSQLFKGELRPEVLVRIDLEGHSLDVGSRSPSSEWGVHCAIYRARPDIVAVVHAHAPHATILANAGLPFLPISTEAAFFSDLPRLPFIMPGTGELAAAVAEAMADSWAVLMVNHGLIVGGRTLRRAADMIEIIDRSAQVILGCYAVGREPPTLPDDVVATLRKMGDLVA